MSDTSGVPGGARVDGPGDPSQPLTNNPVAFASYPRGTPVRRGSGKAVAASADTLANATIIGLTTRHCAAGGRVTAQYAGLLSLQAAEWDAITGGSGGLVEGLYYYVSAFGSGMLTNTQPSGGNWIAPVGIAWSPTTMLILPQLPKQSPGGGR